MPALSSAMAVAIPANQSVIDVESTADLVKLLIVCVVLAMAAAAVHYYGRLGHTKETLVAAARGTLQLGLIGLLIAAVLASWWLTGAFLVLMLVVASRTSGRRAMPPKGTWWPLLAIGAGTLPAVLVLLLTGLVPMEPIAVVPIVGIIIGNAMTATTLCARRAIGALRDRRGEFEAGLSIGLLDRESALLVAREEAALALVPGLDTTRTVGLVTLPGAFVGTLLGGATPLAAAAVQLVVLIALLLAQAIAVLIMLEVIARGHVGDYGRPA